MLNPEAMMDKYGAVFTMVLPYPDTLEMKDLNPHAQTKGGWSKAKATKAQKELAQLIAARHMPGKPWRRARLSFRFFKPTDRTLDHANMVSRFKAAVDGVVLAGLLPDDNDQYLELGAPYSDIDADHPRIEMVFEKIRPAFNNDYEAIAKAEAEKAARKKAKG